MVSKNAHALQDSRPEFKS